MAAYCVILRPQSPAGSLHPRNKRCYLSADTADRAIRTAAADNPEWRAVGVEPGGLFPPLSINPTSPNSSDTKHAA
ncbi:MAG TPA: hypothetical protein VMB49_16235 [Acidobacteriaceae bacterium]|nr:hypothetical protein [Acidobacteriaceae bacterium]